jgi:beta-phosphoglucomutase
MNGNRMTLTSKFDWANIEAVLLDFDGVLMQSIEDHHRSWNEVFRAYGATIGWEEFCVLEGQSLFAISRQLCRQHDIDETKAEEIGRAKNDVYLNTANPKLYDDVYPFLELLRKDSIAMALVTGAHRDRFERSVNADFLTYFDAVITADDVTYTKPEPEPFLKAAKKLGLTSDQCVVIENAPLGITSAKRAGMRCIALRTTLSESFLSEADLIFHNLGELKNIFAEESI